MNLLLVWVTASATRRNSSYFTPLIRDTPIWRRQAKQCATPAFRQTRTPRRKHVGLMAESSEVTTMVLVRGSMRVSSGTRRFRSCSAMFRSRRMMSGCNRVSSRAPVRRPRHCRRPRSRLPRPVAKSPRSFLGGLQPEDFVRLTVSHSTCSFAATKYVLPERQITVKSRDEFRNWIAASM